MAAPDFTGKYNTELSADEEEAFEAFLQKNQEEKGRDLSKDLSDYDVRGWWKAGADTADNGHGPDTYKKPNHPTFSDESIYHNKDGHKGGKWTEGEDGKFSYQPSATNLKHYSAKELARYFAEIEPDVQLVMPTTEQRMFPNTEMMP